MYIGNQKIWKRTYVFKILSSDTNFVKILFSGSNKKIRYDNFLKNKMFSVYYFVVVFVTATPKVLFTTVDKITTTTKITFYNILFSNYNCMSCLSCFP